MSFKKTISAISAVLFSVYALSAPYQSIYPADTEVKLTLKAFGSDVNAAGAGVNGYKTIPSTINIGVLARTDSQQNYNPDALNADTDLHVKLNTVYTEAYNPVDPTYNAIVIEERFFDNDESFNKTVAIEQQMINAKLSTTPLIIISDNKESELCMERTTKVTVFCIGQFSENELLPDMHTNFDAFVQHEDHAGLLALVYKIGFLQASGMKPFGIKSFVEQGGLGDILPERVSVDVPKFFNHGLSSSFLRNNKMVSYKTPSSTGYVDAFGNLLFSGTLLNTRPLVYVYGASSFQSWPHATSMWVSKGAHVSFPAGNTNIDNLYIAGIVSGRHATSTVLLSKSLMMDTVHPQSDQRFDNLTFKFANTALPENLNPKASVRSVSITNPQHKAVASLYRRDKITTSFDVEPGELNSDVIKSPPKFISQSAYTLVEYNESETGDVSVLYIANGLSLTATQLSSLAKYKPETVVFQGRGVFEVFELPYSVVIDGEIRFKQHPIYKHTTIKGNLVVNGAFVYDSVIDATGTVTNNGIILYTGLRNPMPTDATPYDSNFFASQPRVQGVQFYNRGLVFGIPGIKSPLTASEVASAGPHNISGNFGPGFTASPMYVFYNGMPTGYSGFGGTILYPTSWFSEQFKLCPTCRFSPEIINTIFRKYNPLPLYNRLNGVISTTVSSKQESPEPLSDEGVAAFIISRHPFRTFANSASIMNTCAGVVSDIATNIKNANPGQSFSLKAKIDVAAIGESVTAAGIFIARHYFSKESLGYGNWDHAKVCGLVEHERFGKVVPGFDSIGSYTFMVYNGVQADLAMNRYIRCMSEEAGNISAGDSSGVARCDAFYKKLQSTNDEIIAFSKNITPDPTCASYVNEYTSGGSIDWGAASAAADNKALLNVAEAVTINNDSVNPAKVYACVAELASKDLDSIMQN